MAHLGLGKGEMCSWCWVGNEWHIGVPKKDPKKIQKVEHMLFFPGSHRTHVLSLSLTLSLSLVNFHVISFFSVYLPLVLLTVDFTCVFSAPLGGEAFLWTGACEPRWVVVVIFSAVPHPPAEVTPESVNGRRQEEPKGFIRNQTLLGWKYFL